MDMENSYKALFELLWNSQIPCFDVMNVTSKSNYEYGKFLCQYLSRERALPWPYALIQGMIKWCSWKGVTLDCPSIFTLFPTNRGMCCSFNMQKADEMFKKSKYREHMERLTKRDKDFSFDNSTLPDW